MLKKNKNGIWPLYWRTIIRPHKGMCLAVVSLMLAGSVLEMATVGLGIPLLEMASDASAAQNSRVVVMVMKMLHTFGFGTSTSAVLFFLLFLVSFVSILNSGFVLLQQCGTAAMAQILRREVKRELFQKTLNAPYEYFADKSRGAVLYNLSTPAVSIFQVINYGGMLCASLLNSALMVGLMVYLSWWATVAIGVLGIVWVQIWHRIANHRSAQRGRELYELESQINKLEVDAIDGLKVVKAYQLLKNIVHRQFSLLKAEFKPHLHLILLTRGVNFVNELLACIVIIFVGGLALGSKNYAMSFANLVIFFVAFRKVTTAVAGVNSSYSQLHKERKGIEVMDEILNNLPSEKFGERKLGEGGMEEVRVKGLKFHYASKEAQPVLGGIELKLKKGEITAIVGTTGSGKSTLANLLLGFYKPKDGAIFVDGIDLQTIDLSSWRQKIGYVSQDIFLFNDTIRENIVLWDRTITQEEIEKATVLAQLHEHISSLPEGYDTVVGDRGLKLSGGQAQRLAIARAIIKKPQLLVFDEATSALDNMTEKAVYNAISLLRKEAIVVVIAHRLSTVQDANQIAVLKAGKIVEIGRHQTLMEMKGIYSELYQVAQYQGEAHAPN
ncbi:MAG: ABC transporter ATP-binding protein [Deltaproteobacteria bacterium]|nr:ABC transporter ATP-binding protein [Deltaproteobacteria bacterium]